MTHMIKIKPLKSDEAPKLAAQNEATKQKAKDAVHGGPKDVKKDVRMGVGRGQKG